MIGGLMVRRVARSLRRMPERLLHTLRRRTALEHISRRPAPRVVLLVCAGNVYRSPYAAALLRRLLPPSVRDSIRVNSAGFVGPGRPCPPTVVEIAANRDLDLSQHRSRVLTAQDVRGADLILVMDQTQRQALRVLFHRDGPDVLILGDLDPEAIETRAIQDPVDQPQAVFESSYSRIERCVQQLVAAAVTGIGPDAVAGRRDTRPARDHDQRAELTTTRPERAEPAGGEGGGVDE